MADSVIEGKTGMAVVAAEEGAEEGLTKAEVVEITEPLIFTPDEE